MAIMQDAIQPRRARSGLRKNGADHKSMVAVKMSDTSRKRWRQRGVQNALYVNDKLGR